MLLVYHQMEYQQWVPGPQTLLTLCAMVRNNIKPTIYGPFDRKRVFRVISRNLHFYASNYITSPWQKCLLK